MNDVEARQRKMIEKHQKAVQHQNGSNSDMETNSVEDEDEKPKKSTTFVIKTPETEAKPQSQPSVQTISQAAPKDAVSATLEKIKKERETQFEFLKPADPFQKTLDRIKANQDS